MPEVDPKQIQAQATLPPAGATDENGMVPTQSANVNQTLQTPAVATPGQPLSLTPATPPVTATSPNRHLMSFGARILGALAGEEKQYSYSDAGKLVASSVPLTTTQKIGRIIGKVTSGLSAPTPPGPTSLTANIGAGLQAANEKVAGQDVLKRAQAKEDFEQQQQTKLRQHEIARQNALTLSTYYGAKKAANEMDPHFAQNESLIGAVKASPELGAHVTEMSDTQVEQEAAKDPTFGTTHIIKPLGWAPVNDPTTGQQVMDSEGAPKFYMRMGVINGTKDGKITVTPEMAADFQKYGPMARIPNAGDLKAGDSYELSQLLPAMNKIDEQRKAVLDGWQKSELGWVTDKDGKETPVETNPVLHSTGAADATRPLTFKPVALAAEESKSEQEKAAAFKDIGEGKKALAEAALTASLVGNGGGASIPAYLDAISKLPQTSQVILRNVSPAEQLSILKVANGDADLNKVFPTRTTKGSGQLDASRATNLVSLINKDWTQQMYATKQKALTDFSTGDDGKAIASFNQFLVHADDVRLGSDRLKRTNSQWLNQPINLIRSKGMGDPGVSGLMTDIFAARSEWQNFIKSGHASDIADNEQSRAIMSDSSSPAVIMSALQEMGKQAVGRLDQIDSKWRRTWGGHYPGIVSDSGRTAANNLGLGDQIKMYPSESGAFGGVQAPNTPATQNPAPQGADKEVYAADGTTLLGHVVNNKFVALPKQ